MASQINSPLPVLAIDYDEAARVAAVSVSTIRRAVAAGELKAAKLGAVRRIRLVDLDQWLQLAASSDVPAIAIHEVLQETRCRA